MITLDVTVQVTKHNRFVGEDQRTLVHHVGSVCTDPPRRQPNATPLYGLKSGRVTFGQVVEGLHGMDPHNVLTRLPEITSALEPEQRRAAIKFLDQLKLACEWCQKVRVLRRPAVIQRVEQSDGNTVVADLYQNDFELVVKRTETPS